MNDLTDIHALAGAYALDAVDDLERAAFERHIRQCESCALEIAEMRETTARLADAVSLVPPQRMRESVLGAIARTPQERARVGREAKPAGRWRRLAATAVAATVLAAGAGTATWTVMDGQVRDARERNTRIEALLAAPDARLVATDLAGGRVSLVVSPSRNAAVAVLQGLESPGRARAYQLWVIDGAPKSVGLLPADRGTGRAYISELGNANAFAVSREPAAGSRTPSDPVGEPLTIR